MAKQIEIQCPAEVAGVIVRALEWFVESRYPYAADECSAAARETLLDLAKHFKQELLNEGHSAYSIRIRAFVCEAVRVYTLLLEQQTGESFSCRRQLVVSVCRGESNGSDYADAVAQDREN